MKITTTLAAAILLLVPGLALAQEGCSRDHTKTTAMTCMEGMTLDPDTGECVAVTSS